MKCDDYPNQIGIDRKGEICVRFDGEIQRPRFQDEGAAAAFLDGLIAGTRKPEPEGV